MARETEPKSSAARSPGQGVAQRWTRVRSGVLRLVAVVAVAAATGTVWGPAVGAPGDRKGRICRSLLLVLNPPQARLTIESSRGIGFDDGVTLIYDADVPGDRRRLRRLTCAFAKPRSSRPELIAVSSDGRSLGPARLAFLKRFWLASPDAARADSVLGGRR